MKNPLNKRIPRELRGDLGKYLVIFLFMVLLISLVSSFMVVSQSIQQNYDEDIETLNQEDGHLAFNRQPEAEVLEALEQQADITLYPLEYFETTLDSSTEATIRVYTQRTDVNLITLNAGRMPEAADEIVLDRLFARQNGLAVGDSFSMGGRQVTLTGTAAFPDYSCLFESNADMMFDSQNFSPAIMTEEGYAAAKTTNITCNYAWTYPENIARSDDAAADSRSEALIDTLEDVLLDSNEALVDEAIAAGKLVALDEAFAELEETTLDRSMFDSDEGREELLELITSAMEEEDIDLTEEFSEVLEEYPDKVVELTTEDLKLAMEATDADVEAAQAFLDNLDDEVLTAESYLPRYTNKAINFGIDDVGSDSAFFLLFGYLVIAVLAFVFAVTTSNTITLEAGVIGTLRASGYTRGELVRHYMVLPVLVTLIAALVGNLVGYTVMLQAMAYVEYNSFSFAPMRICWNAKAFVQTTVIPLILMFLINLLVLTRKLQLSPLRFLRRDLSRGSKGHVFPLSARLPIMTRFRLRVILQNIPGYLTLMLGIFLGGAVVVFGLMLNPLLESYTDNVVKTRISDYQYIVMSTDVTTDSAQAESFAMTSLNTCDSRYMEDEISIFGIQSGSAYVKAEIPAGQVLVSNGVMEKFKLSAGDTLTLKDSITGELYDFRIAGEYTYDAALAVFMPIDEYRSAFGEAADYFTGYFSNEELALDPDDVAAIVTTTDLMKLATQMEVSMGDIMSMMAWFGVVMFLLLMYLLSKQIIEKNADSIAMTKILGFRNGEIGGLYIVATSVVVVFSLLISIPLISKALQWGMTDYIYTEMTGYLPCEIGSGCYIRMFLPGIGSYAIVAALQLLKIRRVPKADALKTME